MRAQIYTLRMTNELGATAQLVSANYHEIESAALCFIGLGYQGQIEVKNASGEIAIFKISA